MLINLVERAFGVPRGRFEEVPLASQLTQFDGSELLDLIRLRVLCFSKNTWLSMLNGMNKYFDFCVDREIITFPVDVNNLQLCLIDLVKKGKSIQVVENVVDSVVFCSNFIGWNLTTKDKIFKNVLKSFSKLAVRKNNRVEGMEAKEIKILWEKVLSFGGIEKLSLLEFRTFMMINFCFHTLCRFSCCSVVKTSNLKYYRNYFQVNIPKSKTDQEATGQETVLVKNEGKYDPHMLLCLYLQVVSPNGEDVHLFSPLKYDRECKVWTFDDRSLSYSAAYSSFKKFMSKFGLDPKMFSLHSPRVGGTTNLFQNKVSKRIINKVGRWKSSRSKYIYGRDKHKYIVKHLLKRTLL